MFVKLKILIKPGAHNVIVQKILILFLMPSKHKRNSFKSIRITLKEPKRQQKKKCHCIEKLLQIIFYNNLPRPGAASNSTYLLFLPASNTTQQSSFYVLERMNFSYSIDYLSVNIFFNLFYNKFKM